MVHNDNQSDNDQHNQHNDNQHNNQHNQHNDNQHNDQMEEADQAVDLMEEVKDSGNGDKTEGEKEAETKLNEEESSGEVAKMMVDEPLPDKNLSERVTMEEEESTDNVATTSLTIPTKSRSLRTTSVRKRLEIEVKMAQPKTKGRMSKKARLSKYRRKSANAKERERMKKQNDVFEVLKQILPVDKARRKDEDKETKVTTLRSAIEYINSLQSLLDDCEAGRLDYSLVRQCSLTSTTSQRKKKKPARKKTNASKVVEPKWTHYSKQDLRTKFGGRTPPPPYFLPPSPPPYHLPSIVTNISPPPPYCR